MMAADVSDEMKNQELAVESRGSFGSAHPPFTLLPSPILLPISHPLNIYKLWRE